MINHKPTDMEFVKNFTPPDFQAKDFTPSISPNFNSKKKHKKCLKMEKFTPLAKILHGSDGSDKFHLCKPTGSARAPFSLLLTETTSMQWSRLAIKEDI